MAGEKRYSGAYRLDLTQAAAATTETVLRQQFFELLPPLASAKTSSPSHLNLPTYSTYTPELLLRPGIIS